MPPLPPREQAPYFDVSETIVSLTSGKAAPIAAKDDERVAILIGVAGSRGSMLIATQQGNTATGLLLQADAPLMLTHGGGGPLPSQAFYATPAGSSETAFTADGAIIQGVSLATTGVKLSYTVPAGAQAVLDSASAFISSGGSLLANLQLVRGGVTVNLLQTAATTTLNLRVPLQAGDVVRWNCTQGSPGITADFTINVDRYDTAQSAYVLELFLRRNPPKGMEDLAS